MVKKWHVYLAMVGFLLFVTLLFTYENLQKFDEQMASLLYGNAILEAFHYFGDTKIVVIAAALLIIWRAFRQDIRGMVFVLLGIGGGYLLNQVMKRVVERPRPELPDQLTSYSFPSGHTMLSLLLLLIIAYFITQKMRNTGQQRIVWGIALICAVGTGLSRVATGNHFATDVFAGWGLAYAWFIWIVWWYESKKGKFI
ncbi:phosphatase PAP2 family protein [Lysinibacillus sp. KU-BSD001]